MKKSIYILLFASCTILNWGCKKTPVCDCFESAGNPAQETRVLPYFEQVYAQDNVNVVISIGYPEKVVIDGGSNLTHNISATVSNNVLTLKNNNICNWLRSYKKSVITVYITMPRVTYLTNAGVGNITSSDTIAMDSLQVRTTSAGDIDLLVNSVQIMGHAFGSGDITLSGNCTNFFCTFFSGTGFIYCNNLKTSYTFISTASTGDCFVNASGQLTAYIYQRGNIYYTGSPIVSSLIKGPGQVIKE